MLVNGNFIVKKVGEIRSGVNTERDASGVDISREWKARDVIVEAVDPYAMVPESAAVTLWGDDTDVQEGEKVNLSLFVTAREYGGRFYTETRYREFGRLKTKE